MPSKSERINDFANISLAHHTDRMYGRGTRSIDSSFSGFNRRQGGSDQAVFGTNQPLYLHNKPSISITIIMKISKNTRSSQEFPQGVSAGVRVFIAGGYNRAKVSEEMRTGIVG